MKDEILGLPEEETRSGSTSRHRKGTAEAEVSGGIFIDVASIPGVGPARKAALRCFGIETAADVTRRSVKQVKGFGDHLTRRLSTGKRAVNAVLCSGRTKR